MWWMACSPNSISTCHYPNFRLSKENQWDPYRLSWVSSIQGSEYASMMVQLFSFLRSIHNLRLLSFFQTRTTGLAHGLYNFWMAPMSSISWRWALMSSYMWGGICWSCFLKGIWFVSSILYLIKAVLPRSRLPQANWCSNLSSSSLAYSCSGFGHSLRPWKSRASKTHPFWGLLLDSSEVPVRRTTSGT